MLHVHLFIWEMYPRPEPSVCVALKGLVARVTDAPCIARASGRAGRRFEAEQRSRREWISASCTLAGGSAALNQTGLPLICADTVLGVWSRDKEERIGPSVLKKLEMSNLCREYAMTGQIIRKT